MPQPASPAPSSTAAPLSTVAARAVRIEREREVLKTGERSVEATRRLTSLGPERAGPEELLRLARGFTYDEDRCRAYVRHLPRIISCLTNAAAAIARCGGRFSCMPEADRHYAARARDALDAILIPPGG